jgi:hypothetical protein
MPEHSIHDFTCNVAFWRTFKQVDDALDWWVRILGRKHRKVFHDIISAPIVGAVVSKSWEGAAAAGLHILIDEVCSKNKRALAKNASQQTTDKYA